MKHGWEIKKLGDVCEVINGFAFKSELFRKEGDAILRISNIQKGLVDLTDIVYFSKFDYPKVNIEKYEVLPEDIVVALSGATTGKFGINKTNKRLYLNQRVAICREKVSEIKHMYLFYYLKTLSNSFLESAEGVAQPNLSTEKIKQYNIPIPPLPIQERIVSELDCINGILEKKREQIKELDALAQSIFYDMFGDPIQNEKGWEVKKLGDVAEIIGGSTPKTNDASYWNGEYFWITPAELDGRKYFYSTSRTLTDDGVKSANLQLLPIGTVLLSSRAPIGKVAITCAPMYCNQGFKNIVCSDRLNNEYVYSFLLYNNDYLNSLGTGATFKEISKRVVSEIPIPLPPLPLQQAFAAKIKAIEKQKELVKRSIAETETLLASRMQHYFEA